MRKVSFGLISIPFGADNSTTYALPFLTFFGGFVMSTLIANSSFSTFQNTPRALSSSAAIWPGKCTAITCSSTF